MGVAAPKQLEIAKQAPPIRVEHLLALHHVIDHMMMTGIVFLLGWYFSAFMDVPVVGHSALSFIEWDTDLTGRICHVECATAVHKT